MWLLCVLSCGNSTIYYRCFMLWFVADRLCDNIYISNTSSVICPLIQTLLRVLFLIIFTYHVKGCGKWAAVQSKCAISRGLISSPQLIKTKRFHRRRPLIRRRFHQTAAIQDQRMERKSRPLACHLLEQEGSFQTRAVRITGWGGEKVCGRPLFLWRDWSDLLPSLPASALKGEEIDLSSQKKDRKCGERTVSSTHIRLHLNGSKDGVVPSDIPTPL